MNRRLRLGRPIARLDLRNDTVTDAPLTEGPEGEGTRESDVFESAARELRWHYQMVVVREFLPGLVGAELVRSLLDNGPSFYRPAREPFIPLEFADAAYRYGHSQIRHSYTLNSASAPVAICPDLIGFRPVSGDRRVDWTRFFDAENRPPAARAKKIDGRLVGALIALPVALTGESHVEEFHSLAVRDLQRGQGVGLPSGEAVARRLDETPLSRDEVLRGLEYLTTPFLFARMGFATGEL
jgi:hypothetical protein